MTRIGLIAGSGRFPLLFAQEARRMGEEIVAIAIPGVTEPALKDLVSELHYFKLGQINKPIAVFKKAGIKRAVMAGKVRHDSLFGGLIPDLRAAKILWRVKDRRTDTILTAVAEELSKEGIELLSSTTFLSHLLAAPGILTKRRPSEQETADMVLGWKAAKALSSVDIGQTAVVSQKTIVAVEAMEGTDACVLRAGDIARSRGKTPKLTVVKTAKPRQDCRFDIPIVGLETLKVFSKAGVSALALEAGSAMIFDKDDFLRLADAQNLAVASYDRSGPDSKP